MVNFIIDDLGNDWESKQQFVEKTDVILLLCGTKPYELPFTGRLQRRFEGKEVSVLCPFVVEVLEYQLEPTIGESGNKRVFETVIKDYITGA